MTVIFRQIYRWFAWGLMLVALAAGGCAPPADQSTLTFMVFGDPAEREAYLDLVDGFHAEYPQIKVAVTHIPSPRDYRTRLATEFAAGSPPDVTLMNYRRFAAFAARDMLEPLGPYLVDSDLLHIDEFYPVAVEAFTWGDTLMCIPQNISSLVVYYNQDLFDDAGIAYPDDDWGWDEFVEAALALTKDLDGDGATDQFGVGIDPSLYRLTPIVWQNSGPIVNDEMNPSRLTLTRPPSLQALEWLVDLAQVHQVAPGRVEEVAQDSESRFVAGTLAMFFNSRRGTPTYRRIDRFGWDVAPLPRGKEQAGILHSDGYCLSATSQNKPEAWTFIEFANSVQGQSIVAVSGRTVPSLQAVAASDVFLNPSLSPSRSYVWLDAVDHLRRVPVISTWEEIEQVAGEEIERAFYGEISAEEAAILADARTEEYFQLGLSGPLR